MNIDEANINVKLDAAQPIVVNIEDAHKIDVVIGDAAKMDVQKAVNYIESGKAELEPLVLRAEVAADKAELYASTFVFEQGVASDTWEIEHNLGKKPSVTIVDSANNVITPEVEYVDDNNVVVLRNGATTGYAYLN